MAKKSSADAALRFVVEVPPDLAADLDAFCEHHFDASRTGVVRRAIKLLIEREAESDSLFKRKLEAARAKFRTTRFITVRKS